MIQQAVATADEIIEAIAMLGVDMHKAGGELPVFGPGLPVTRRSVRRVAPLVRRELGEEPLARVTGLRTNWGGRRLMSRYG